MMSHQEPAQPDLFSTPKDLGAYVARDHMLRRVAAEIDFDFVYAIVESKYGAVGHESTPPPVILKLMLLLTLYNVSSARELMRTLPYRIDWLWFVGYRLGEKVPDHSVLSKARTRWGAEVFVALFERILERCKAADLIGGTHVHTDASLIDANASIDSLFRSRGAAGVAAEMISRLEPDQEPEGHDGGTGGGGEPQSPRKAEPKYQSRTDPDATGTKQGQERMRPRYKTHRVVDDKAGVITSTHVGPGHENEAEHMVASLDEHARRTGTAAAVIAADTKYGTMANLEVCEQRGLTAYIPPYRAVQTRPRDGRFGDCEFRYDAQQDLYTCPAGEQLHRKQHRPDRKSTRYMASRKACSKCPVRSLCTTAKTGPRSLLRHDRQDLIDRALALSRSPEGRQYRGRRMWVMEGSFARSKRFGFDHARWRGLDAVGIQDYLVAGTTNLLILCRHRARLAVRTIGSFFRTLSEVFFPPRAWTQA